ncbi:hypothetical protein LQ757_04085 [Agromyces sp. SYSU K20354]|uniref:hypothetical protein n=1 Tax=Agromyces cavernae TaxID=2898659 RepID=UPI001E2DF34E|nr:hypothetical protein [Agromyces cavernae]MCD2441452.1 hypothetical protein [Agromyces cavernae]
MPTTRPRFQVTETPEVERALKVAEAAWPDATRAERVVRLLAAGADALEHSAVEQRARRIAAVMQTAGLLDEAYEPGYLERLREEWRE